MSIGELKKKKDGEGREKIRRREKWIRRKMTYRVGEWKMIGREEERQDG